jgi:hypothetical protein
MNDKRRDENGIVLAICLSGMAIILLVISMENLIWQ